MRTIVFYIALAAITACTKSEMRKPSASAKELSIHYSKSVSNEMNYFFALRNAENESTRWYINEKPLSETGSQFRHTFEIPGTYTISAKVDGNPTQSLFLTVAPAP